MYVNVPSDINLYFVILIIQSLYLSSPHVSTSLSLSMHISTCWLVLLFEFGVHSNTAERRETPIPNQAHPSAFQIMQLRLLPTNTLQALPGINSCCVQEITMTISNHAVAELGPWRGWGNKCITASRAQWAFHMEVSAFPIPPCLTRWSAELLVLVLETVFLWLVHACLQMGS